MSHKEQVEFIKNIKKIYPNSFYNKNVLEIGSLNINGSVRDFFTKCVYIGLDIDKGPDVDVVCIGHEYNMPDGSFDTVISCECFEHDPYYLQTFQNMIRLCKTKGLIMFSCATIGRKEHGTKDFIPEASPLTVKKGWDYYKNLCETDFTEVIDFKNLFESYHFQVNNISHDLYFYGIKN